MLNLATSIRLVTCAILIAGLLAIPAAAQNGLRPLPPGGFYMADMSNPDQNPVIVGKVRNSDGHNQPSERDLLGTFVLTFGGCCSAALAASWHLD